MLKKWLYQGRENAKPKIAQFEIASLEKREFIKTIKEVFQKNYLQIT